MFIRVKETETTPEVNLMIPSIASFAPNDTGGSSVMMLNGIIHEVGVTCRMLRHQVSKFNKSDTVSDEA